MAENDIAAPPPETADAAPADDWRGAIEDARLRAFADRFASPADAVKTAFELRRKLSTEIVPDGPEAYALNGPDGAAPSDADRAFRTEVAALFHEARMTLPQAAALARGWNEMTARTRAAQAAADARAVARAEHELRRDWGADYDRNRAMAERAVARFHDGDSKELLGLELGDGRLLGSLPSFVRYAAKVGEGLIEDTLHADAETGSGSSLAARIDEIHSWQHAPDPAQRAKYRDPATQAELSGLYKRLHGEG